MTILQEIAVICGNGVQRALDQVRNLETRMTSAEANLTALGVQVPPPTGGWTMSEVQWTNVSEINLSGEKLTNGDFSQVSNSLPTGWAVHSGTLNQAKLAEGVIKGDGGSVSVQQMFPHVATGTKLVIRATRNDIGGENIRVLFLRSSGTPYSGFINIDPVNGFAEFETTESTYGIRLDTAHGSREVSDISLFQGVISGGTVQTFSGGSLEKISGGSELNAGARSVQSIDGNTNGFVQFQIGKGNKRLKVGLVPSDHDYNVSPPYVLEFTGAGEMFAHQPYTNIGTYEIGDWFRIRHYANENQVAFQKRQTVYSQTPDFAFPATNGSNFTYPDGSEPIAVALLDAGGLTSGGYYKVKTIRGSDGAFQFRDLDDNVIGWQGASTRTTRWEVVQDAGEDYVTFYTHPSTTSGVTLYIDTAIHHVGGRINDVQLGVS